MLITKPPSRVNKLKNVLRWLKSSKVIQYSALLGSHPIISYYRTFSLFSPRQSVHRVHNRSWLFTKALFKTLHLSRVLLSLHKIVFCHSGFNKYLYFCQQMVCHSLLGPQNLWTKSCHQHQPCCQLSDLGNFSFPTSTTTPSVNNSIVFCE